MPPYSLGGNGTYEVTVARSGSAAKTKRSPTAIVRLSIPSIIL